MQLTGGSEESLSDYIFVYGVTFDSTSLNSVTEIPGLLVRKKDISAIAIGAYGVFDDKWTEKEVEEAESFQKELRAEIQEDIDNLDC